MSLLFKCMLQAWSVSFLHGMIVAWHGSTIVPNGGAPIAEWAPLKCLRNHKFAMCHSLEKTLVPLLCAQFWWVKPFPFKRLFQSSAERSHPLSDDEDLVNLHDDFGDFETAKKQEENMANVLAQVWHSPLIPYSS